MALSDDIQQLYIAYFNRPADPAGLAYWTEQAGRSGGSTAGIANAFSASAEYRAAYGGLGNTAIVSQVYQNLFGRSAEPAGLQGWAALLGNGSITVGNIVTAIAQGALNADAVALANKALAAAQFTAALATPAQAAAYSGSQAAALAKAWLDKVVDPASLSAAAVGLQPVIITITSGPVVGGGAAPAVPVVMNFVLTAGADTGAAFTGGALDDTFTGTVAGALGTGDNLDGGGGNDTLTVTDPGAIDTTGSTVVNIETATLAAGGALTANTTAWTGLASLTGSMVGAATVSASGTTAVGLTATGAGQGTGAIAVNGGKNVTLASGKNTGGTITIGASTAPAGTVVVTSGVDSAATHGAIAVTGGTTVSVTQTAGNAVNTTATLGNVTVSGGAATTSVTVLQTMQATAAAAVAGVAGVAAVTGVTAAPGLQPVAAVAGVTSVAAVAGTAGVVGGQVQITDAGYNTTTANTIASVTLGGWGSGSFIRSNALASLSLTAAAAAGGSTTTLALTNATNGAGGVPTAAHALALTVNGLNGKEAITVTNNDINVLNVTTTGADSALASFTDTGLTTLNIGGSKVLTLPTPASVTAITLSGAAGYNDGNNGSVAAGFALAGGGTATFTTTSSGRVTLSLATTQGFDGSTGTGVDTITISSSAAPTLAVRGSASTTDELILAGTGAYASAVASANKISGFEILGVAAGVTGTIDVGALGSSFTRVHLLGASSSLTLSNLPNNATIAMDGAATGTTLQVGNTTGATDTLNLVLGTSTTQGLNYSGNTLLRDSSSGSGLGIGTVNIVNNGPNVVVGTSTAAFNTMGSLSSNGLTALNFSGTQGLLVAGHNQTANQATAITLNNTSTSSYGLNISSLSDSLLTSLTFAGSGITTVGSFSTGATLTLANTGTQTATMWANSGSSLILGSLTLTGNVQIGNNLATGATSLVMAKTTGITVSGATDHAHVKLVLGAATTANTNTVTLGNGNNDITDGTTAGTVNITVGTGSNTLTIGGATTNTTGTFNITLGTHSAGSGADYITVGTSGSRFTAMTKTANYTITGADVGDRIIFRSDASATLTGHTGGVITPTTPGVSESATIVALWNVVQNSAHAVAYAQFGGNTYVAESISATASGADDTIVKLVGLHTLTAGVGYVEVAS